MLAGGEVAVQGGTADTGTARHLVEGRVDPSCAEDLPPRLQKSGVVAPGVRPASPRGARAGLAPLMRPGTVRRRRTRPVGTRPSPCRPLHDPKA
jgi:hypothetical protein